jgi:adenosylhomocysteinase
MPALREIEKEFTATKPLAGLRVAMSIHLEAKTANLALVLKGAGAEVSITGCNPLSTQDDVCAALAEKGVEVHAVHNCDAETYDTHLAAVLAGNPHLVLDDGGDLTEQLHGKCEKNGINLRGITEETTTGVARLRSRAARGQLKFPAMAVNDAEMKHLFDNRYGTGQSTWDAILNTTNLQVCGKRVVVAGYGWCGRGVAIRAKGLGADVIVTEIDPVKAIEAVCDGMRVMTMDQAAPIGDFFITVTGCKDVITERHFKTMQDGVILCNTGHFDVEVSGSDLAALSTETFEQRKNIIGYRMADGRVLNLLAEGRLVNLAAGNGHPVEIMDMSFAVQALALRHMAEHGSGMKPGVYDVPYDIDAAVSAYKLRAVGVDIDELTEEQKAYYYNHP